MTDEIRDPDDDQVEIPDDEQEKQASKLKPILDEFALSDRWKGESDEEIMRQALRSYSELEQHKKDLVQDNEYWRNQVTQQLLDLKRQQSQPPPQHLPQSEEEVSMARLKNFILETVKPEVQSSQHQQMQQQVNYDTNMRVQLAKSDPRLGSAFTKFYDNGEIGREITRRGYPTNWTGIEAAFNALVAQQHIASTTGDSQVDRDQQKAEARRAAGMEGAGPRSEFETGSEEQKLVELEEWALRSDVTAEQVEARIMKEYKIPKRE